MAQNDNERGSRGVFTSSAPDPWDQLRSPSHLESGLSTPHNLISPEIQPIQTDLGPRYSTITPSRSIDHSGLGTPIDLLNGDRGMRDERELERPPIWRSVVGTARQDARSTVNDDTRLENGQFESTSTGREAGEAPLPLSTYNDRSSNSNSFDFSQLRPTLPTPASPPPQRSAPANNFVFNPWPDSASPVIASARPLPRDSNSPTPTSLPPVSYSQERLWSRTRTQQEQSLALQQRQERQQLQLQLQQEEERQQHLHDWQHPREPAPATTSFNPTSQLHSTSINRSGSYSNGTPNLLREPSQLQQYHPVDEPARGWQFDPASSGTNNVNRMNNGDRGIAEARAYDQGRPSQYNHLSLAPVDNLIRRPSGESSFYNSPQQQQNQQQQQPQHQQPQQLYPQQHQPDLYHQQSQYPPYQASRSMYDEIQARNNQDRIGASFNQNDPYRSGHSPAMQNVNDSSAPDRSGVLPSLSASRRRPLRRGDPRESLRSGLPVVPAHSPHAMWAGNVPADATHAELWKFFTERSAPARSLDDDTGGPEMERLLNQSGVESIHLITRSNCSFVNYVTERHLLHAIRVTNGVSLRPHDRRCKALLCRVRAQEDDAKSGVGAQRGTGMHRYFLAIQQQQERPGSSMSNLNIGGGAHGDDDGVDEGESGSTTSSLLESSFPKRYFILKSHNEEDLQASVVSGTWATQGHNEATLDQAFRTAKEGVYIVFSVNKSGEWYGYARMTGPVPAMHIDSSSVTTTQITPPSSNETPSTSSQSLMERNTHPQSDDLAIDEALGTPFKLEWIKVLRLPFARTRTIVNSFNMNREVKISRDGTEIEPLAGERLLREFWLSNDPHLLNNNNSIPSSSQYSNSTMFNRLPSFNNNNANNRFDPSLANNNNITNNIINNNIPNTSNNNNNTFNGRVHPTGFHYHQN